MTDLLPILLEEVWRGSPLIAPRLVQKEKRRTEGLERPPFCL
jgi:hypothetical protein